MRGGLKHLLYLTVVLTAACSGNGDGDGGNSSTDNDPDNSPQITRPQNVSCSAFGFETSTDIQLTRIFPNLSFNRPVLLLQHPEQNRYWYVVEQGGNVFRIDADSNTRSTAANVGSQINLASCNECGLLGMTFHPDFANNQTVYLSFTENRAGGMFSVVSRFTSNDSGATLDLTTRDDIFEVVQPYSNHNGGHIAFGPDGYLYLGLGDGGSANDPDNNGQSTTTPLGAMLRLQDNGLAAPGNAVSGDSRIFAYGLRNPWRWSFDRQTGALWAGDVGQNSYEEVDIVESGGNYGWRCQEGRHQTNNACTSTGPYTAPVTEYDHSEGISITGGYVYRGDKLPALSGVYIFGDYGSGQIWGLFNDGGDYTRTPLLASNLNIASFAEDSNGELYVVSLGGTLYRIDPDNAASATNEPPSLLSQNSCVNAVNPAEPADGLIAYDIIEPFWSDGAVKERYLALPNDATIDINADGDLDFPSGSVLLKIFRLQDQLIETRLFMRQSDGAWRGFSYRWNNTQTDATLLDGALDVDFGGQTWHYPARTECSQCHTSIAGFTLGPELAQLNRDFDNPVNGVNGNQLEIWEQMELFTDAIPANLSSAALTNSRDDQANVGLRARSYLHSNCSTCHRTNGPAPVDLDLRYDTLLADTGACDLAPQAGDLGITDARIIAPGDAARSVLLQRMNTLDGNRMPPLASNVIDSEGVSLIEQWINALSGCNE